MPSLRSKWLQEERKQKAPEVLFELLGKTDIDTDTINSMLKSYVQGGDISIQSPRGSGPDSTKSVNVRPRLMTFDESTQSYGWMPDDVSNKNQVIAYNSNQKTQSTPAWTYDENGQAVPLNGYTRQGYVTPPRKDLPRNTMPRETSAAQKERLAVERVITQLRQRMKIDPLTKMIDPIKSKQDAIGVAVGEGLDVKRYPEIEKIVGEYEDAPPPDAKQLSLFDRIMSLGKRSTPTPGGDDQKTNEQPAVKTRPVDTSQRTQEIERRTKDGKIAIFDATSKQFLRWKK